MHNTKQSHQLTKEESKSRRNREVLQEQPKTSNKMAVSTHLLIITLMD